MVGFYPSEDRVLVRQDEAATKTESGIHIPGLAQVSRNTGVVVATGPGKHCPALGRPVPVAFKAGERVVFVTHASPPRMQFDLQDGAGPVACLVLRECDIYGTVSLDTKVAFISREV